MFHWNPVADDHKNGIILGYRWVFFNSSGSVLKSADAADMTMAETFGGLEVWRNYSFILCAYTIKGDGNWSAPMTVATDEEGKGLTKQVKADCFNKVRVNSSRKHPPLGKPRHLIHDESQGPGIWQLIVSRPPGICKQQKHCFVTFCRRSRRRSEVKGFQHRHFVKINHLKTIKNLVKQ